MTHRPRYTLTLEPLPRVGGVQALRAALKRLLRNHGLRCVEVSDTPGRQDSPTSTHKDVSHG